MKVIDINGKKRKVEFIHKIMHDTPDAITGDMVQEPFVEVVIKGKQSTWTEWWPLADFEENNPDIEV